MEENQFDREFGQNGFEKKHAFGLWTALGFDNPHDYTNEEMVEILSRKLNTGDISLEEMKAAVELVKSQRE